MKPAIIFVILLAFSVMLASTAVVIDSVYDSLSSPLVVSSTLKQSHSAVATGFVAVTIVPAEIDPPY